MMIVLGETGQLICKTFAWSAGADCAVHMVLSPPVRR